MQNLIQEKAILQKHYKRKQEKCNKIMNEINKKSKKIETLQRKLEHPIYIALDLPLNLIDLICEYRCTIFCLKCRIVFPKCLKNNLQKPTCAGCMPCFDLRDDKELENWIWYKLKRKVCITSTYIKLHQKDRDLKSHLKKILTSEHLQTNGLLSIDFCCDGYEGNKLLFGIAKNFKGKYTIGIAHPDEFDDEDFIHKLRKEL